MKKYLCVILLLLANFACGKNVIEDYQRIFLPMYTKDGNLMIALRIMKMNNVPSFLIVNPQNFVTAVMPVTQLQPRNSVQKKKPGYFTYWNIASTPYYQLLNKSTAAPYLIENQGLNHADKLESGNVLTIDLCPSSKPFEATFFQQLVKRADALGKATPITIAITGMWLIEHPEEFQWLQTQEKARKLDITWANHSFSHVYYKDLPYSNNFLLSPATNIDMEILLTEKYLLEAGETPSVFFRFPGLVSNESLIKKIKEYGLIPLGTDAWIANLKRNHQEIIPGSILLIHGNSNEHKGVIDLLPLLDKLILVDIKNAI